MNIVINVAIFLISAIIFSIAGYTIRKKSAERKIGSAESEADKIIENAKREAENARKEEIVKAKEEIFKSKNELDDEIRERRVDIQRQERRLIQKEENLDKKISNLEKRDKELDQREDKIEETINEVEKMKNSEMDYLEQIAKLSQEDAKNEIMSRLDESLAQEKAERIKEMEDDIKEKSEDTAKNIITYAIQKCAADHTAEATVSTVTLPNDEIKGRIIGREGRNIKTLETLTGVDFIIDDTPEAVVISGFDALRREVARIALEKLIDDGRIHPAKIEEKVEEAKAELTKTIKEEGERAAIEAGVINLPSEIIMLLGKLKYRTSYGQNVLKHSVEVSHLARIMAEELGLNTKIARRAGLLHDIGKALDHDMEGTHVQLGVEVLKKYKEDPKVINAVEAHHDDVPAETPEAILVKAADAISSARPGSRRETLEAYIKRLESLETIANSFEGVEKSFAIQAGREVRIIVEPEKISDAKMVVLARDVAHKIEDEMDYPGQIKVNIIREKRITEYAK